MTKIDKTNWWEHLKNPNDIEEYVEMFKKYDPKGYERHCDDEHEAAMAQAKQERQAFRNTYETNDEQRYEMECESLIYPFDPQAQGASQ